jgi:hypothetical protein
MVDGGSRAAAERLGDGLGLGDYGSRAPALQP